MPTDVNAPAPGPGVYKAPPWEKLAEKAGISSQEAYAFWQQAMQQEGATGEMADTLARAAALINAAGPAAPGDAPPGGPTYGAGGSGGSGISAADRANQIAGAEASFASQLRTWGIELSPRLQNLVSQAAQSNWNSAQFTQALRGTKEYNAQFPGIQWKQGMSEATYNSMYNSYRLKAQDARYTLSREGFAHTLKKGIDAAEWALRVTAVKQINANKPLLESFRQELVERGIQKPGDPLNPKEVFKLATGRGSAVWTSIWNEASVETGLEGIGVTIGKSPNMDFTRKELAALLKGPISKLDPGSVVDVDFANIAATMAKVLPASQLYRAGITKKDLVREALGAPGAQGTRTAITRVLGTATERWNEAQQASSRGMQPGGGTNTGQPAGQATE